MAHAQRPFYSPTSIGPIGRRRLAAIVTSKKKKQRPNNFHLFAPFSALRWPRENHRRRPFNSATKKKKKEKFFFSSSKMAFYQLIGCIQFFVSKIPGGKWAAYFTSAAHAPMNQTTFHQQIVATFHKTPPHPPPQ